MPLVFIDDALVYIGTNNDERNLPECFTILSSILHYFLFQVLVKIDMICPNTNPAIRYVTCLFCLKILVKKLTVDGNGHTRFLNSFANSSISFCPRKLPQSSDCGAHSAKTMRIWRCSREELRSLHTELYSEDVGRNYSYCKKHFSIPPSILGNLICSGAHGLLRLFQQHSSFKAT